jgi:branched-chain amino acid transport system permease protein
MLGTMRIVNLPHGSFYLLGGCVGYSIAQGTHNFFLACLSGLFAIAIPGVLAYKAVLEKRFAREVLAQILLRFGMLLIMADVCRWIWGGNPLPYPSLRYFMARSIRAA